MPTPECCEPVVASVGLGDHVPCLYRVAEEEDVLITSGLNINDIVDLYTACGGLCRGGRHLADICEGIERLRCVLRSPPAFLAANY